MSQPGDVTSETRSLLSMIHRYQIETMKAFEQRKKLVGALETQQEQMMSSIRAAQQKQVGAQEESKVEFTKQFTKVRSIRLSVKVKETGFFNFAKQIVFPSKARLEFALSKGEHYWLTGFENNRKDGSGNLFNFIFSNGQRS